MDDWQDDGGGDDGSGVSDHSDAITPIADFASLATTRLAREGCAAAIAAGRVFEEVAGLGLDMRWANEPGKRVVRLIAIDSHLRDAIDCMVEIVGNMRAIRHLVVAEAKALHEASGEE